MARRKPKLPHDQPPGYNTSVLPLLALTLLLGMGCSADTANETQDRPVTSADGTEIRAVIDQLWTALSNQNESQFQKYCADGWNLYTASGNTYTVSDLLSAHRQNFENFKLVPSNVQYHISGDLAWVTYRARMSGLLKGEKWSGTYFMTNIFQRQNGQWLSVHMHESKITNGS